MPFRNKYCAEKMFYNRFFDTIDIFITKFCWKISFTSKMFYLRVQRVKCCLCISLKGILICTMINILFEEELGDPEDDINENHDIKTEARVASVSHPELNITTTPLHPNIVVYNRVPKCGSQTLSMLINQLGRKNDFLSKAVFEANEKPEVSFQIDATTLLVRSSDWLSINLKTFMRDRKQIRGHL